ncbi:glycosyltransferase family 4 protein [Geomonas oryzae]|uniref:glycosyltransferase family 4 protein n=1 Tax=Geomonas oryzae TaxID=2364273 RepID=UPI00100B9658|nr:glycosyltransferase family 4 protein [Geomonas oryzae]
MDRLRIAIWHNLPSGGGKRQLYNHVKGLLERGHYLESWCPDTADQKFLPLSELIKEHVVPLPYRDESFSSPTRSQKATRLLIESFEEHCRECASQINNGNFDVLYANACLYFRTTAIAKYVGLPSALYLGEPYRWFYEASPELPWIEPHLETGFTLESFKEQVRSWLVLRTIRLQARAEVDNAKAFDVVLCNSIYSRESILRAYDIDSKVCYLGVNTEDYRPTGEEKEDFLIGLGTLYRGKGVDRAIRAVGAVEADKRPTLVWVGNGASETDLESYHELARQLRVKFFTKLHIPDEEVVSLLSRARAMIYTSRLEPFGLAPLEANACCTPVIGIAEGGVKETVKDGVNGYLALDGDTDSLAALITKIIDDPAVTKKMGINARQYVEQNWHHDFGTNNIEHALVSLVHQKGIRGILNSADMRNISPTGDLKMNFDVREFNGKRVRISGWGIIDDGKGSKGASSFLLVQGREKRRLIPMKSVKRLDVTSHFGGTVDCDNSGFFLDCEVAEEAPKLGIVIVREEKVSLQFL